MRRWSIFWPIFPHGMYQIQGWAVHKDKYRITYMWCYIWLICHTKNVIVFHGSGLVWLWRGARCNDALHPQGEQAVRQRGDNFKLVFVFLFEFVFVQYLYLYLNFGIIHCNMIGLNIEFESFCSSNLVGQMES